MNIVDWLDRTNGESTNPGIHHVGLKTAVSPYRLGHFSLIISRIVMLSAQSLMWSITGAEASSLVQSSTGCERRKVSPIPLKTPVKKKTTRRRMASAELVLRRVWNAARA
jgi:hypothetical protein